MKHVIATAVCSTADLDTKLENADTIQNYISENETEFDEENFYALLNTLILDSGKTKAAAAADSDISEAYLYNLLNGEKRPTRDTVIKLAFGLELSLETTERLLKLAGYSGFYVRHKRDAIIKFMFMNNQSLTEAAEILAENGFSIMRE